MKHTVKLSTPWEAERIDGHDIIQIRCVLADVGKLVLALCMLREGLVESLVIPGPRNQKLEMLQKRVPDASAIVQRSGDKTEIRLPLVSVDMVIHFYLIYHRDGFADVSHVDLETSAGGYLTFFAADVKPPLSANDLAERLRRSE